MSASAPLEGKSVVVTRAAHQASAFVQQLREMGAEVVEFPVIDIVDPEDGGAALQDALAQVHTFEWAVFTSANAVERAAAGLHAASDIDVAAIGTSTAQALQTCGITPTLVPATHVAEALLAEFPDGAGRVLFPRAAVAREVLPEGLRAKGWEVVVVDAYRTVPSRPSTEAVKAMRNADMITFTSASTVNNFVAVAGPLVPPLVVCIGPVTANAAEQAGIVVDVVASEHTIDGVVRSLRNICS